ncbi:MAG: ribbon-helix-helix protein, CopG family [Bryobacterales bacterium]|nr:ribbon-helix-helix protein, CopG family [Bryobacterales bacterium]
MKDKKQGKAKVLERGTAGSVRASVSFPEALYRSLEEIAKQKKVSLAWVVRDAAELYVAEKWPLFRERG